MDTNGARLSDWFAAYERASKYRALLGNKRIPEKLKPYADEFDQIMSEWIQAAIQDYGELDAEDLPHLSMSRELGPNMADALNKLITWANQGIPLY